eukprot:1160556-Pelagomonas_calceolata.AAC.8
MEAKSQGKKASHASLLSLQLSSGGDANLHVCNLGRTEQQTLNQAGRGFKYINTPLVRSHTLSLDAHDDDDTGDNAADDDDAVAADGDLAI